MRYDLTVPIKDLSGVQITDRIDPEGYTLRSTLVRTALFVDQAKPLPSAPEKLSAWALAKRIAQANHYIDLSLEEVASLQAKAGIMWTPLVLGQLSELLESPITLQEVVEDASSAVENPMRRYLRFGVGYPDDRTRPAADDGRRAGSVADPRESDESSFLMIHKGGY